jgi:ubiquinone/menaquinone biosynthesis C-methylase UbiE
MRDIESPFGEVPIDAVRDYWNERPCNVRHSAMPVGTREYFDEVEARKYFVESHIRRFAEFERWRGKKVLEIGCGIGTDTINFARCGAAVTAVELSENSLAIARQRAGVFGLQDRIRFYQGNAENLADIIPSDTYDLVYSFGVIHHTPHPERVLQQVNRFTSSGSVLKLMVYNRRSWKVAGIVLWYGKGRFWRMRELIAEHSEAQTGSPVTYAYTRAEMQELLARNGYALVEASIDHIFPYRVSDYVNYRYVRNWYFRFMPRPLFEALERRFGWHLCVTAVPSGDRG